MSIDLPKEIRLAPLSFSDVDLFSEWETGLGWDIQSAQLSAGSNEIGFDHLEFPGLIIANFRVNQAILSTFALPKGMTLLLICRTKLPLVWSGRHLQPTTMGIVRSHRENWAVIPPGMDCYEFMVSDDLIERTEFFPRSFYTKTTEIEHAFLPLAEPITGEFLRAIDGFFEHARRVNGSHSGMLNGKRVFDFAINGLQQLTDAGLSARGWQQPRRGRRAELVRKGVDFIHANLSNQISVNDIAQALGVSYRVLNYAFIDSLNVSPYRYVLTEKLHAARRELKNGEASISETCFLYGFETPSRFTRQYERLFGELPSETKKRIRGASR